MIPPRKGWKPPIPLATETGIPRVDTARKACMIFLERMEPAGGESFPLG